MPHPQIAPTPQYAVAAVLDANTGDAVLDGAQEAHGYPLVEIAVRVLRTPKGSLPQNPLFGVEQSMLDVARPNVGADYAAAVKDAFRYYTQRGMMTRLSVDTEVVGSSLRAEISFYDPQARRTFLFSGDPRSGSFTVSSR